MCCSHSRLAGRFARREAEESGAEGLSRRVVAQDDAEAGNWRMSAAASCL